MGNLFCGNVLLNGSTKPLPPAGLTLGFPGPNPFDSEASIAFSVDQEGAVLIVVYDVRGALVATLVDDVYPRGEFVATWDGRGTSDNVVSRGTYFIRATFRGDERFRKITFVNK